MPSFISVGEDSTVSLPGLFYANLLLFGNEISQSGAYFAVPKTSLSTLVICFGFLRSGV